MSCVYSMTCLDEYMLIDQSGQVKSGGQVFVALVEQEHEVDMDVEVDLRRGPWP